MLFLGYIPIKYDFYILYFGMVFKFSTTLNPFKFSTTLNPNQTPMVHWAWLWLAASGPLEVLHFSMNLGTALILGASLQLLPFLLHLPCPESCDGHKRCDELLFDNVLLNNSRTDNNNHSVIVYLYNYIYITHMR